MRNKILIFIDIVAHKNQLQTEFLINSGLEPYFFVSKYNSASDIFLKNPGKQMVLENSFSKRYKQVSSWIKNNKSSVHHLEVHPGGRYSFIYILLAKLNGIKSVCVERGDLLYFHRKGYTMATRASMWLCYKMADIIWYREPYMKPILEKMNRKLFFLHNAVKTGSSVAVTEPSKKEITFLWLNRLIPERRSDWYISVLNKPELENTVNYLVGVDNGSAYKKEQDYVKDHKPANLLVFDYTSDPASFYKRAKYFVLPSEVVFANHALLEAMSYGEVPLISEQMGSAMIVENGVNGFIFKHTKEDFETTVLKAFHLNEEEYRKMSLAASDAIKKEFSNEKYQEGIKTLYNFLIPGTL